jgi:hypothetical protein
MASASTTSGAAGSSGTGEWAWWPLKVAGTPWNVSDTMTAWALWSGYNADDPLTDTYAQICAAANPGGSFITGNNKYGYGHATPTPEGLTGTNGSTDGAWEIFCEMCLRARLVLYCESVIGDCGASIPISAGGNTALGLGEQAAGAAASLIPVPGVGAIVGAAIGDIGGLLSGQAHAQAVSTEKQTLCSLAAEYSQQIQNAYAAVEAGSLSASSCVTYINSLASSFKQDVEKITKACNAACGMIGVMNAHAMLAPYLLGITAPVNSSNVRLATGLSADDIIGSDISVGGNQAAEIAPSTALASTATPALPVAVAPSTGISTSTLLIALVIAVIAWVVL